MFALWMLVACSGESDADAIAVRYDPKSSGTSARSVQAALDELYVRCGTQAAPAADAQPVVDETAALATRVGALELRQAELVEHGVYTADKVGYDPRKTTLSGKTVQEALDELEARVQRLEDAAIDHGKPGAALFELRDKHGNPVSLDPNGGQNGKGPNGPNGMPPNGRPNGQPPNGPPPNGQPQNGQPGGPQPSKGAWN
jgi:hypothetical protein